MSEYTAERAEHRANHFENAGILDIAAMLRAYAATLRQQATNAPEIGSKLVGQQPDQGGRVDEGLFQRACEVVHHETDCPAIGGNGDADCRCDAVPFLRDLNTFLTKPTNEDAVDRAVDAFHDVYDGVSHNLRDAVRHVLATAALAQNAQGEAVFQYRYILDKTWRDCDEMDADAYGQTGCHEVRKLYLHAERARVPEGMVLVPREPTPEMRAAHSIHGDTSDWWNAVLAAAPSQPEDAIRFPFGSWSPDGHWTPNPALKLSEREQRKHNEQHGYPTQPEDAA